MSERQNIARRRQSLRLPTYDYRGNGAYFVTICSYQRRNAFAAAHVRAAILAAWDAIPEHFPAVATDSFVMMPNHVHGIVRILRERSVGAQHAAPLRSGGARRFAVLPGSLGAIIRSFKAASTKRINEIHRTPGTPVWQRNYYERVIRDERELAAVREYIALNPLKWELDHENPGSQRDAAWDDEWGWLETGAERARQEAGA